MSDAGKPPVRVTILNQQYALRAPDDPREVEEVARSVDELLHSIAERAPSADPTRIAVLGCLHLADQLRTLERTINDKSEKLAELLDALE
jgi:cell division protein ZapA